jgi:AraC-like DNA-binding protein
VRGRLAAEQDPLDPDRSQPERAHHVSLHTLLAREGAGGVLECGRVFATSTCDPLVEFLATSRGPLQLAHRYQRIEPMFHLGHGTETRVTGSTMTFRHVARLGAAPELHDSLFVCGATIGMFVRIGVSDLRADLADSRGVHHHVWPATETRIGSAVPPMSWTLSWNGRSRWSETLTAAGHDQLRGVIAANPERRWNARTAANATSVSVRTLQRRLQLEGTTIGKTVVAGRLDAATALVVRTSLDLTTVALACGFADLPHLTHHFRRRSGHPPGRYRTIMRGE